MWVVPVLLCLAMVACIKYCCVRRDDVNDIIII
jgi:hypothetical protein